MIFDTHMHCQYSIDSKMSAEEAKAAALQQNLGIIITEHWDEDYPTNPEAFVFDIEDYFKQLGPYRSKKLLLGIEVGMQEETAANDNLLGRKYPFDFIDFSWKRGLEIADFKNYMEKIRYFQISTLIFRI